MALSEEQIAKLKEHVKNKLIEMGTYVDDQLPDYVMIMVTNKKTEKQMIDDLDLFLGGSEPAAKFIDWLNTMIKKVTSENNSSGNSKTTSSSAKTKSAVSRKSSSSSGGSGLNHATSQNESDELAIQIEADEFNEDFGDESGKNRLKKAASVDQSVKSQVSLQSQPSVEQQPEPAASKPAQSTRSSLSSTVGAVIKRDHVSDQARGGDSGRHHRDSNDDMDDDDGYRRKRKLSGSGSGSLSSVVKVSERKYAVPRSMQPNKNILLKAVDAANTSVQHSGAASSSSSGKAKSIADLKLEEIRAKRKSMPSNEPSGDSPRQEDPSVDERRDQSSSSSSVQTKRLRTSYSTSVVTGHYDRDQRKAVIDENGAESARDLRKVQIETSDTNSALKALDTNNKELEPKFIVTLTGLDEDKFTRSASNTKPSGGGGGGGGVFANRLGPVNQVDDDEMNEDVITAGEEMDLLDEEFGADRMDNENTDEQVQKKKLVRCVFWPQCDKGDQCAYLHPNKPCTTFPNCPFGQQCHFLHPKCRYDGFCTRLDCPFVHMIKKPTAGPIVPPVMNVAPVEANEQSMDASSSPATGKSMAPKVTINKIQPIYSLVNKPAGEATAAAPETGEKPEGEQATATAGAAQQQPFVKSPATKFRHPGGNSFYRASHFSNQFSFVSRQTANVPTVPINCKFATACKNPRCPYVHPSVVQKASQFKWTASSNQPAPVQPDLSAASADEAANQVIIS